MARAVGAPEVRREAPAPSVLPWVAWAGVSLLRYRARLDELIGRVGLLTSADGTAADGTRWSARDDQLSLTADGLTVTCKANHIGHRFEAEPLLFRASSVASYVDQARRSSLPEQRLWRWVPGRRLIEKLVTTTLSSLGVAEASGGWLCLSPELARLLDAPTARRARLSDDVARRLALHVGDPEIATPLDDERIGITWARHAAWIRELIQGGESAVAEALPCFVKGPALVRACDQLLARSWNNAGLRDVVRVLREHPEAPPSPTICRLVAAAVPGERVWHVVVAAVAPYLLERGIDRRRTVGKLAAMARVDAMTSDTDDPPVDPELLLCTIAQAPDAALAMIARGLRARDGAIVCRVAGLVAALGDPWCIDELRNAIESGPPHRSILIDALAGLSLQRNLDPASALGRAVAAWRRRLMAPR